VVFFFFESLQVFFQRVEDDIALYGIPSDGGGKPFRLSRKRPIAYRKPIEKRSRMEALSVVDAEASCCRFAGLAPLTWSLASRTYCFAVKVIFSTNETRIKEPKTKRQKKSFTPFSWHPP